MSLFTRLFGDSNEAERLALESAEKFDAALAGGITEDEAKALGQAAIDLSKRFELKIDVREMRAPNSMLPALAKARADLLKVASSKPNDSPSQAYLQLHASMRFAALYFYNLIVLRTIELGGPDRLKAAASSLAENYSARLFSLFPD